MTAFWRSPWLGPSVALLVVLAGFAADQGLGLILAVWLAAWGINIWLSNSGRAIGGFVVPILFGATLLVLWELAVRLYEVSPVILPAPSAIWARLITSTDTLWADFVQTIVKGAMSGYVMGCAAAFAVALAVDRSPFLQRGLLPVGNFIAALPIVGTAPILVMWYGFGWQSKAAVVVVMVFFPMLVNTVQGLKASEVMQRDLMRTYAASYWQTLFKLRLPAALPFIFNGLKICTTLALIGAIVAEFFGSPTVGMGFRIKIEVGRLAMDMVWSSIVVAALAGTGLYGLMAMLERKLTFWHPSQR
ncbi:ABC transporter permease [Rhodophyticola porphyridii]|uniref:ABC transporter permease n=1 Tax=Rhodophyticola porphyridii TaxID=1852017 RepID=A0A3L9Y2X7_9RHOB|nr:ABC transporter permease [Rhodophyticola porphyridii]RMA43171.1 ABC transporter permease [Rhodophyticola porphyridii]